MDDIAGYRAVLEDGDDGIASLACLAELFNRDRPCTDQGADPRRCPVPDPERQSLRQQALADGMSKQTGAE